MDPIKDGVNWYVYAINNPLKFVDPNGLEVVALHGGALGITDNGGQGGKVMVDMASSVGKLANTNISVTPNFQYGGGLFASDYTEGVQYLNNYNWIESDNKNLVGFSVGADAVANYLIQTSENNFNIVVIDAAKVKFLTQEIVTEIAKKCNKLIIIIHEKDYMDGNVISDILGGGDRKNLDLNDIPENTTLITINNSHDNSESDEAIDNSSKDYSNYKYY
jgi:hypothetical protein